MLKKVLTRFNITVIFYLVQGNKNKRKGINKCLTQAN